VYFALELYYCYSFVNYFVAPGANYNISILLWRFTIATHLSIISGLLGQITTFPFCSGALLLLLICRSFRSSWGKLRNLYFALALYYCYSFVNDFGAPGANYNISILLWRFTIGTHLSIISWLLGQITVAAAAAAAAACCCLLVPAAACCCCCLLLAACCCC
jgi:hypothetical protein